MVRKERKTWIIYPEYFDKTRSRSESRKVPIDMAIDSPKIEDLGEIFDEMDIPNRIEEHQHHPSNWFKKKGRIIIPKQKGSKLDLLKKVGKKLKNSRK